MKYQFERTRSDFWITVYENDDAYSISTNDRYVDIINYFFRFWKEIALQNGEGAKIMQI